MLLQIFASKETRSHVFTHVTTLFVCFSFSERKKKTFKTKLFQPRGKLGTAAAVRRTCAPDRKELPSIGDCPLSSTSAEDCLGAAAVLAGPCWARSILSCDGSSSWGAEGFQPREPLHCNSPPTALTRDPGRAPGFCDPGSLICKMMTEVMSQLQNRSED